MPRESKTCVRRCGWCGRAPRDAARAQALSWLGTWLSRSGRLKGRAVAEEALQLSRQAGDKGTEAHALITLAELNFHEHGVVSLDLLYQARTLAGQAHAYDAVLRAAVDESHLLEGVGEHERAAQVARQGIASAREYGLARVSGTILAANVAEPLIALGLWDEAAGLIEHALELFPPPGTRAGLLQMAAQPALGRPAGRRGLGRGQPRRVDRIRVPGSTSPAAGPARGRTAPRAGPGGGCADYRRGCARPLRPGAQPAVCLAGARGRRPGLRCGPRVRGRGTRP